MTRTNAYSILCVFIRVFSLWLFVSMIVASPRIYALASRNMAHGTPLKVAFGTSLFQAIVAVTLWIFADKLARLALARPQQIAFESEIPAAEWQSIAFSVLGMWQVVEGTVYLAYRLAEIAVIHVAMADSQPHFYLSQDDYFLMLDDGLRIVVGLVLLFGARGIVGLVRRYRQVGHAPLAAGDRVADVSEPPAPV